MTTTFNDPSLTSWTRQRLRSPAFNVAAAAVLAGMTPAAVHEFLGHGAACLAVGGHPTLVSTSLFQCTVRTPLVAAGGPAANLLAGLICLLVLRKVRPASANLRVYLALVTAFAWFWEGGYAVQAMLLRAGDLYDLLAHTVGPPGPIASALTAAVGALLYLVSARLARAALRDIAGDGTLGRRVSRIAWTGATLAVAFAAATSTLGVTNFVNSVMAIGVAGLPLLVFPPKAEGSRTLADGPFAGGVALPLASLAALLVFAATLGHGLTWQ